MEYYVYVYYENETPIYVGKGKNQRYLVHLTKCFKTPKGKIPFHDKLRNMLEKKQNPKIEIVESNLTETDALLREKYYYDLFGNIFDGGGTLYNYLECGRKNPIMKGNKNPRFGKSNFALWVEKYGFDEAVKKDETYRKKLSSSLTGKIHTKKTKKKMKLKREKFWKERNAEQIETFKLKISNSHDEKRKKDAKQRLIELNKIRKGELHPKSQKCLIEGVVYNTISEVCVKYGFKNHNTVRNRLQSKNFPEWTLIKT